MWKTEKSPEILRFIGCVFFTSRWVNFGDVWIGFRVFHQPVKNGEWKVKNRGKIFDLFRRVLARTPIIIRYNNIREGLPALASNRKSLNFR